VESAAATNDRGASLEFPFSIFAATGPVSAETRAAVRENFGRAQFARSTYLPEAQNCENKLASSR
jgi:hypothetical protein